MSSSPNGSVNSTTNGKVYTGAAAAAAAAKAAQYGVASGEGLGTLTHGLLDSASGSASDSVPSQTNGWGPDGQSINASSVSQKTGLDFFSNHNTVQPAAVPAASAPVPPVNEQQRPASPSRGVQSPYQSKEHTRSVMAALLQMIHLLPTLQLLPRTPSLEIHRISFPSLLRQSLMWHQKQS